jgi:hypothetical protein
MQLTKTNALEVPGASLHFEVRGSGPVLLVICAESMTRTGTRAWPSSSWTGTRW